MEASSSVFAGMTSAEIVDAVMTDPTPGAPIGWQLEHWPAQTEHPIGASAPIYTALGKCLVGKSQPFPRTLFALVAATGAALCRSRN